VNRKTQNSEALFKRIHSLSDEADWSVDELREALSAEGIDPDRLVKEIKMKIEELSDLSSSLPLLPRLRRVTGLKATAIAEKLGMSVPFLSDLSSHPNVIPFRARQEFTRRVLANLPGVSERDLLDSFGVSSYQQAAAYRDTAFPEEDLSFEKIVRRSDLSEEQQQYWLSFGEGGEKIF
jgi:hypothetical protein